MVRASYKLSAFSFVVKNADNEDDPNHSVIYAIVRLRN